MINSKGPIQCSLGMARQPAPYPSLHLGGWSLPMQGHVCTLTGREAPAFPVCSSALRLLNGHRIQRLRQQLWSCCSSANTRVLLSTPASVLLMSHQHYYVALTQQVCLDCAVIHICYWVDSVLSGQPICTCHPFLTSAVTARLCGLHCIQRCTGAPWCPGQVS